MLYRSRLKPVHCHFGMMRGCIVLLENNISHAIFFEEINKRQKVLFEYLDLHIFVDRGVDEYERAKLVANKTSPYHLQ